MATDRVHDHTRWMRPMVHRADVAHPPRLPRFTLLRSSCGYVLGIGYVWKRQAYIAWKRCA